MPEFRGYGEAPSRQHDIAHDIAGAMSWVFGTTWHKGMVV